MRRLEGEDLERLVARCRHGDERAWSEMVERFQRLVYSIPRRMGLREDDAADVFQSTFVALYRSLDRIESPKTIPKWLSVTASRESLRVRRVAASTLSSTLDEGPTLEEVVADEERNAEQLAVVASESHHLRDATDRLGGRCSKLLTILYFEEDVSYQAVSERLSIPVGAIGPTRSRCLQKLRKILHAEGFFSAEAYFAGSISPSYQQEP